MILTKAEQRKKKHRRVRKKIVGTAERPRLAVHRSLRHIAAQLIDDDRGHTLVSLSTQSKDLAKALKSTGNQEAARTVGMKLAERAKAMGIARVVFDRGGNLYHGRVKALADAARKGGLAF